MNITIIFSAIHIHIKTISYESFYCCGDAAIYCLLQFSATIFTIVALIFLLSIFLSFPYLLFLLCICRLTFVDCIYIFFQYTLNEQLTLRRMIHASKQSCNFFKMQFFIGKDTQKVKKSLRPRSHDELKTRYLLLLKTYSHQTLQGTDVWWDEGQN